MLTYLVALLQPSFLGRATRHGPYDACEGAPVWPRLAAYHPHAKSTRCNEETKVKIRWDKNEIHMFGKKQYNAISAAYLSSSMNKICVIENMPGCTRVVLQCRFEEKCSLRFRSGVIRSQLSLMFLPPQQNLYVFASATEATTSGLGK